MRREDSATDVRSVFPQRKGTEEFMRASLDLTVLGICTGSGLSHLNFALVRFGQNNSASPLRKQVEQFGQIAVPSSVRDTLVSLLRLGRHESKATSRIDELLARLFSGGIKAFCRRHALDIASIDLVGTHTEALQLLREKLSPDGLREHQLNWNRIVALETGISTVFDFAIIDRVIAQSCVHPIAHVDTILLQHPQNFRVCLSINELSTLSFIPAYSHDGARATISRDCGPGSLLIDYTVRYCTSNDKSEDRDGKLASLGRVNHSIVDRFLSAHDYIRQPPSLSIATEMFGDHEAQQLVDACLYSNMSDQDTLTTVTRATAQNILNQYHRLLELFFPPEQRADELFICGLGARNSSIIDYLKAELPESVVINPLHDVGIPGDAYEAVRYAQLALEAVLSLPTQSAHASFAPSSTYPQMDAVRANVVPGRRWNEIMSRVLEYSCSGGEGIHASTNVRITGNLEARIQDMDLQ